MSHDQQEVYEQWEQKQRAKYGERPVTRTQPAIIDGKMTRVETPEHQNIRMKNALKRWEDGA